MIRIMLGLYGPYNFWTAVHFVFFGDLVGSLLILIQL
jgi:hypothetical protein